MDDDGKLSTGRTPADVLRDSRRKRTKWYELDTPARRAVQVRLPQQGELYDIRSTRSAADVRDLLAGCAIDWRGFIEADILGSDQGGDSPVPFSRDLFEEWVFDHIDALMSLAGSVITDARARGEKKEDAAKNSETS